jgi:hypothetical protein
VITQYDQVNKIFECFATSTDIEDASNKMWIDISDIRGLIDSAADDQLMGGGKGFQLIKDDLYPLSAFSDFQNMSEIGEDFNKWLNINQAASNAIRALKFLLTRYQAMSTQCYGCNSVVPLQRSLHYYASTEARNSTYVLHAPYMFRACFHAQLVRT